jgi:DNA-directed RNA polymerase specialized sigma24 family protein
VAADTLIRVARNLDGLDPERNLFAYVSQAAKGCILHHRRNTIIRRRRLKKIFRELSLDLRMRHGFRRHTREQIR